MSKKLSAKSTEEMFSSQNETWRSEDIQGVFGYKFGSYIGHILNRRT